MADIRKLTNANVYFDGASWSGKVKEVNLPDITSKQAEHNALGMFGVVKTPTGIEPMELEMMWTTILPDVKKKVYDIYTSYTFQVRSSLEEYNASGRASEAAYVADFRGRAVNMPSGSFKQHENVEATTKFQIDFYRLEINGEEIIKLDVLNNIYEVDGVDKLATYRANLGI
jgi:P2 family phage contractile tail tube protein